MRLLIHSPYFRPHVGGVEAYVEELSGALWATGRLEGLTILAPDLPPGAPPRERDANGTRIVRYPALEAIPNFPVPMVWRRAFWRALRAGGADGADLVVANTRFFLASAVALLQARALRVPYVHVEHGSDHVQLDSALAGGLARLYDDVVGRPVLRRADACFAVSEAARAFVGRLAGRRAELLYRGLPVDLVARAAPHPAAAAVAAGRPLVVYVGRLIDGKGVADLLEAVAALRTPVACCVVGDGPRRADLEALAGRLGIAERVRFAGYVPEPEAVAWLRAADVVVNPSYTEGLPTAVLLAAACGRAVVATDVGGTREIFEDGVGGRLVEPRRVAGLVKALQPLVDDPGLRARTGEAARAGLAGRFDWAVTARRLLAAGDAGRR